ncbi:unnamed protein product [Prunus brigantina]
MGLTLVSFSLGHRETTKNHAQKRWGQASSGLSAQQKSLVISYGVFQSLWSEDDGENDGHKDDHSDDSMVSDASSGPSHHHHGGERSRGHGLAVDKKAKKKPKEKQQPRAGRRKEEKKDKALLTHAKKR